MAYFDNARTTVRFDFSRNDLASSAVPWERTVLLLHRYRGRPRAPAHLRRQLLLSAKRISWFARAGRPDRRQAAYGLDMIARESVCARRPGVCLRFVELARLVTASVVFSPRPCTKTEAGRKRRPATPPNSFLLKELPKNADYYCASCYGALAADCTDGDAAAVRFGRTDPPWPGTLAQPAPKCELTGTLQLPERPVGG